jgi:hypothetical protein
MAQEIHYEIFTRRHKGGWKLVDVQIDRELALKQAQGLMVEGIGGVKVVKETYNEETGDFLSLKIFEDGRNKMKTVPAQEDVPFALPCFRPEDLYSYHARQTIARLIPEFLARHKATVTELIHRADLLERLEATGTLLQHAIQKIAVAQASSTTTPVQKIIKSLHDLIEKSFHRVYRDSRNGVFPEVQAGGFGTLADKLADKPAGAYVLNGAIARYLSNAKGWDEKVFRLVDMMDEANEGTGGALLLSAIDTIIAETLGGSAALQDLIGAKVNLGAALMSLVELFLGREPAEGGKEGLVWLTKRFAKDELPESRTAIAERIMAEFKSVKRLCPDSLFEEFKTLRRIANHVVTGVGKYLSHEDLIAVFTLRSKRLITHETLGEHLADAASPDERLERLLFVEDNIIGVENKRQLATFVIPIVTANSFEAHFHSPRLPVLTRLQKLGELNARVRHSSFQENQRAEIADHLDRIACEVAASCKLFESFDAKPLSHVEKAIAMLRLIAAGTFTEPRLSAKVREMVVGYLARPGFLTGYVAHVTKGAAEKSDTDACVAELMKTLEKAGITHETGLKSIAA